MIYLFKDLSLVDSDAQTCWRRIVIIVVVVVILVVVITVVTLGVVARRRPLGRELVDILDHDVDSNPEKNRN